MQSIYNFIIKPKNKRYNNTKQIGEKELLINSEISDHRYVSRNGIVLSKPILEAGEIQKGDEVIVHHNVFRRWHDIRGNEQNSKSYYENNKYFVTLDQIFLYKRNNKWHAPKGYCFIQPIKNTEKLGTEIEKPIMGIVKYSDGTVKVGDLIGYRPNTECEFIVDGVRLYRVLSNLITIKYEYQGNEETYNPSWA